MMIFHNWIRAKNSDSFSNSYESGHFSSTRSLTAYARNDGYVYRQSWYFYSCFMGEKLGFGMVFSMFYPLQIPSTGVMGSGTSSAEPPTVAALGGTGFTVSPEGRAIHHSSNEHRCHIGGWKMIPYAPWWNIKSNMCTLSKINQFFVGFYIPAPWWANLGMYSFQTSSIFRVYVHLDVKS